MNLQKQLFADVLQNLAFLKLSHISQENMCWSLFQTCNFIKKRLHRRYFPMKFAKFLRALFLENSSSGCYVFTPNLPVT